MGMVLGAVFVVLVVIAIIIFILLSSGGGRISYFIAIFLFIMGVWIFYYFALPFLIFLNR